MPHSPCPAEDSLGSSFAEIQRSDGLIALVCTACSGVVDVYEPVQLPPGWIDPSPAKVLQRLLGDFFASPDVTNEEKDATERRLWNIGMREETGL